MPEYIYAVSESGSTFRRECELIRCRDCRFFETYDNGSWCIDWGIYIVEDDYCSHGMRETDERVTYGEEV